MSDMLKDTITSMVFKVEQQCAEIKEKIFQIKDEMKEKAVGTIDEMKKKGKAALNKAAEEFNIRRKLDAIRENLKRAELRLDGAIDRIDKLKEDVELNRWEQKHTITELTKAEEEIIEPVQTPLVAEDFQYGDDYFDASMKIHQDIIQKDESEAPNTTWKNKTNILDN